MNERERIELIMKCYNLTPSQFADRTGIQRASVSHIISGRNKASLEVMQKISAAFPELDMKWLITGAGDAPDAVPEGNEQQGVVDEQPAVYSNDTLFPQFDDGVSPAMQKSNVQPKKSVERKAVAGVPSQTSAPVVTEKALRKQGGGRTARVADSVAPVRKIKEIRIFYSDGTYEIMLPEK